MSQVLQKKLISVHDFTTYKLGDSSKIFFILLSNNLNPLFLLGHFQPPMSDRNLSANPATVDILYSGIFKSKLNIFLFFSSLEICFCRMWWWKMIAKKEK